MTPENNYMAARSTAAMPLAQVGLDYCAFLSYAVTRAVCVHISMIRVEARIYGYRLCSN